jgi:hypothetical protein
MQQYNKSLEPVKGLVFLIGPLLFLIGTLFFLKGNAALDGAFGFFAGILFVPIYLGLGRLVGIDMPKLGVICAALGLFGGIAFVVVMQNKVFGAALVDEGIAQEAISSVVNASSGPMWAVGLVEQLFPLTFIFIGYGLLRTGIVPWYAAVLLLLGGLAYFLGDGLISPEWDRIFYPLSAVLLLGGCGIIGLMFFQKDRGFEMT